MIDTRVKLFQILLMAIGLFIVHSTIGLCVQIVLLLVFLTILHLPKQAVKLTIYFFATYGLYALLVFLNAPTALTAICFLLRRMTPLIGIASIFLYSISVSQLISAMSRLHFPKSFVLALAIMLRFVPTIASEVSQIKDALALRGRPLSILSIIKSPLEMSESVLLPLMMRGTKIADELSASAVTRGIENPKPRTSRVLLVMRRADWFYLICVCVSSIGLFACELISGG